jgi:O-antigen ligase
MPEHLRAFAIVFLLSVALWPTLSRGLSPVGGGGLRQLLPAWFWLTAFAFLSHSFWLYGLLAFFFLKLRFKNASPVHLCALFCLLLFAIPPIGPEVPGLGIAAYLFELTNTRLLTFLLLVPAALKLMRSPESGRPTPGKIIFLLLLITFIFIQTRGENATNSLRRVFYLIIDFAIPYYVFSRAPRSINDFRLILGAFCSSVILLSAMAFFEFFRSWNLYLSLIHALGAKWNLTGYLPRDGMLRASGTTGQAIVMGYVAATGLGFWLYISNLVPSSLQRKVISMVLGLGFFASLSRGPWLGFLVMFVTHSWLATGKAGKLLKIGLCAIVLFFAASLTPQGQRLINLLPFVGKTESENVKYREKLLDMSLLAIERNPWFGSENYLETPEMQEMIQGQGIIDIVNTYLLVALDNGLIGLTIFVSFFLSALIYAIKQIKTFKVHEDERALGISLASTLVGILLMISSVSPVSFVPTVFWMVAALCNAFAVMHIQPKAPAMPARRRTT